MHGDEVCFNNQSVSVPKRPDIHVLRQDVLGRDMPQKSGCIVLKPGEYMLLSPDVQSGFDSRYFGPVIAENILGAVQYLEETKNLKSPKKANLVGVEG